MKKNLVQNFYKKIIHNLKYNKNIFYKNNDYKFTLPYKKISSLNRLKEIIIVKNANVIKN